MNIKDIIILDERKREDEDDNQEPTKDRDIKIRLTEGGFAIYAVNHNSEWAGARLLVDGSVIMKQKVIILNKENFNDIDDTRPLTAWYYL